jgi:glutamine cyclotransferase
MDDEAEIVREYGPFPGSPHVHGITFDGSLVWFATSEKLQALEPDSGKVVRALDLRGDAGTAFDGKHLFQIAGDKIHKIDPASGKVLSSIPAPAGGRDSGLAFGEGSLWVGEYRARKIHRIDPATGAILSTLESNRFVTGVSWTDGELWHGTWEGDDSDLRQVDAQTGEVRTRLRMPAGTYVSGLEADKGELFYAGGGSSGRIRAIRKPRRKKPKR